MGITAHIENENIIVKDLKEYVVEDKKVVEDNNIKIPEDENSSKEYIKQSTVVDNADEEKLLKKQSSCKRDPCEKQDKIIEVIRDIDEKLDEEVRDSPEMKEIFDKIKDAH